MRTSPRRTGHPVPLYLFIAILAIYVITAGASLWRHSLAPHFVYLAESFLRGQLDLIHIPAPPYDLTLFEGLWYVSFPPLPALMMLPFVALRGLAVSDIAFSVLIGALNIPVFYAVLARLRVRERDSKVWLCIFLAAGTPLWYCAAFGSVWYTSHVVAVVCVCLYALEVLGRNRPLLAGVLLGLGSLARAPVVLAFPLAVTLQFWTNWGLQQIVRSLLLMALGMLPALLGQGLYNWSRFGNPLEFGYQWMNSPGSLLERQATWGQFSLHFLPENLYTLLIRSPLISLAPLRASPDPWGMGLLLTSPALLLALPFRKLTRIGQLPSVQRLLLRSGSSSERSAAAKSTLSRVMARASSTCAEERSGEVDQRGDERVLRLGLCLSVALVQVPSLLYFNTGSYQFGYRFALDWLPLGILLIALETGGKLRWYGKALIVASLLMHAWGILWMYPNFNGQPWHLQFVELLR